MSWKKEIPRWSKGAAGSESRTEDRLDSLSRAEKNGSLQLSLRTSIFANKGRNVGVSAGLQLTKKGWLTSKIELISIDDLWMVGSPSESDVFCFLCLHHPQSAKIWVHQLHKVEWWENSMWIAEFAESAAPDYVVRLTVAWPPVFSSSLPWDDATKFRQQIANDNWITMALDHFLPNRDNSSQRIAPFGGIYFSRALAKSAAF